MKTFTQWRIWQSTVIVVLLAVGCSSPQITPVSVEERLRDAQFLRQKGVFSSLDPWILTTNEREVSRGNRGIFLGNGFLGAGFGADSGGDKTTLCTVAGVYNNERLAPIFNWNTLQLASTPGQYRQMLDMKRGLLTTRMSTRSGAIEVTAFVSQAQPQLAVLHVEGEVLPAALPTFSIPDSWQLLTLTTVSPHHKTWRLRTHDGKTTLRISILEKVGAPQSWTRFVFVEKETTTTQTPIEQLNYDAEKQKHVANWAKLWRADIRIEGDARAQQLVHSLMFSLLSSTREGAQDSIPPESWSGDFYGGHIFWDAEIWMFPALLAQHPNLARSVLDYRFRHLRQAREIARKQGFKGADFPWESAASGRDVAPREFQRERHVTAAVGWSHWQYWLATNDQTWLRARGWPVLRDVADFWASRVTWDKTTRQYEILNVMGPDEFAPRVNNNTYTNAMARNCLNYATEAARVLDVRANPKWSEIARNLVMPFDAKRGLYRARDGDRGEATKQADGELIIYPANLPMSRAVAEHTFDFHRARPIRSGPAMTTSIHTLVAARLGRRKQAETYFRESYRPFVRGPFLLFSEKRTLDRCVFTTGIGGVLQSVLYGFCDLRGEDFAAKSTKRKPVLPKHWQSLTISGIKHKGKNYSLRVTPTSRSLVQIH